MKEEIKNLRVQIDGLAQLVKSLGEPIFAIDSSNIPKDFDAAKFLENWEKYKTFMVPIQPRYESLKVHTKELEKTYDSLILAKAWLGKILQELGKTTPYANDGQRKTVEDIEPAADTAKVVVGLREPFTGENSKESEKSIDGWELNGKLMNDYDSLSHIEKVDWLREEIKKLVDTVGNLTFNFESTTQASKIIAAINFIYQYLSEARFWLGFELGRVRDSEN